ncbi:MAG: hypothetical protein ACREJV_11190, partial [Candidatus Rokuibacteriota bacterium]
MAWDRSTRRPRFVLLLPALLVAALSTRCALPTATNEPYVDALQQLKERRADVEGYSRACFTRGWGADPAYATMSKREASRTADELIAVHAQRLADWETCHREIGPKLEAYRATVEQAKKHIHSAPHVTPDDVDRIGQLLDQSVQSTAALVRDAFPTVIELERAYVEHFRELQASPPDKKKLAFPSHIESRERHVIRAMHDQVASAASYVEAFHRLAPSPETRARMNAARIMAAIYRGLDDATADDERSDAQRFRDFRQEVQVARKIVEGEISDPAYAKFRPQTVARYRTMLGELKQADQTLGKLVTRAERGPGGGKASPSGKVLARFQAQTGKLLTSVQAIVTRVERL